jgi:hypothetical protein
MAYIKLLSLNSAEEAEEIINQRVAEAHVFH